MNLCEAMLLLMPVSIYCTHLNNHSSKRPRCHLIHTDWSGTSSSWYITTQRPVTGSSYQTLFWFTAWAKWRFGFFSM